MTNPPPPSKAELDRINKELEKLRQPKPPAPRLSPGGSMTPRRDRVDRQALEDAIKQREERAKFIEERLAAAKREMEKGREKFRER